MDRSALRGIFPPIMTPMFPDESADLASLKSLTRFLLDEGVHGFWVLGTTGEFPTFDETEREAVLNAALETVAGRVPVIASVSDASTKLTIRHARAAERAGVD